MARQNAYGQHNDPVAAAIKITFFLLKLLPFTSCPNSHDQLA
jgi:hypothetical protein